jgi:hypothetical protein
MYATQDAREGWLVGTSPLMDRNGVLSDELDPGAGYLLRDGVYAPLVRGYRETRIDPAHKWTTNVHIEAIDALGRTLSATGELLSRWGSMPMGCALFRWTWDGGCVGYGEDETGAPLEWMEALDGKTFDRPW